MLFSSLLLWSAVSAAPQPVGCMQSVEAPSFAVRAKKMRLEDDRVVDNGVLLVDEGHVRAAGAGLEIPSGYAVIDHDGFVSAGLVACHGYSGMRGDMLEFKRSVTPDARVIDVFDPEQGDLRRALESGITTLVVTPLNGNLVSGVTAVVKTSGGHVVSNEGHLSLTFTTMALRMNRYPTSIAGAIAELDKRFTKPEGVFERAASGRLPVLLETSSRDEMEHALDFAKRHELRGAIYGAALAGELAADVAKSGLSVIVSPLGLGAGPRNLNALAQLGQAKVPLAFGLDAPWNSNESARWSAALALRAGVDRALVWNGLTSQGARVAGAGERVGKLERGYDADFVLWSGDPLDLTSAVCAVYVDGRLAFEAPRGEKR